MDRRTYTTILIVLAGLLSLAQGQTYLWNQRTDLTTFISQAGAYNNGTEPYHVETADDFNVTLGQRWKLSNVTFEGAVIGSPTWSTFTGWIVKIYDDFYDTSTFINYTYVRPNNCLFNVTTPVLNNGGLPNATSVILNLQPFNVVLSPGRYWLSVLPIINSPPKGNVEYGGYLRNVTTGGRIGIATRYAEFFMYNVSTADGVGVWYPQDAYRNNYLDLYFSIAGATYVNDVTKPTFISMVISTQTINLNNANPQLVIVASFNDTSGISAVNCYIQSPSGSFTKLNFAFITGVQWGVQYNFPTSGEGGSWTVYNLTAVDGAGPSGYENTKLIDSLYFVSQSIDNNFDVVAYSPSPTPSPSATPSPSITPSSSSTPSTTPTPSSSPTPSPSISPSAGISVSPSATPSISPEADNNNNNNGSKKGTNTTAIAVGVVLGVVVCGGVLIAMLFVFFLRRRRKTNSELDMAAPPQYHSSQLGLVVRGSEVQDSNFPPSGTTSGTSTPHMSAYNTIPMETTGNSSGSRGNLNSVLFSNRSDGSNPTTKEYQTANAANSTTTGASTSYGSIPVPRDAPTGYGSINKVAMLAANRESFEIDYNELEFEAEVGRGAYGVVYKGKWRGGEVAIKQILTRASITDKEIAEFKSEAALMAKLRPHTNVVQFLGITLSPQLCIVTEFLEHGSLYDYIRNTGKMDATMLSSMVKGIAAGMLHLHREGIIHRDLAARNILLGKGLQVKISDFGMSRMTDSGKSSQTKSDTGPLKWMAPESIRSRIYSVKSDVWAFGVTVWEVVTRQEPYPELDAVQTALEVTHNGLRLEVPEYSPPVLKEIMASCFQTNPDDRPDFDVISKKLNSASLAQWSGPYHSQTPSNNNTSYTPSSPSVPQGTNNSASQQYGSLNDQ